jgi:transposase
MSIRAEIKKQKNKDGSTRDYLYLVESYWDKAKKAPRQRSICSLGRIDALKEDGIVDKLIQSLQKYSEKIQLINVCTDISPESSKTYGEIVIFKKLWKEMGFKDTLNQYFRETNKEINLTDAVFAMVCNRLVAPSSKRATDEWIKEVYEPEFEQLKLHHLYRAMDFLVENKEKMEVELFNNVKNLFNCKVQVVMFDTTNVSYWGEGKRAENLLAHGHAKNKRFDLKQVTVGLIMDQNGVPLGHEVWPGNMSDKPAFKAVIEKVKTKFEIEKVILVADRGMVSEDNIAYLEENNYGYILGVKMRQLSGIRQKLLLNNEGFLAISKNLKAKQIKEYELWQQEINKRNEEINKQNKTAKRKKKATILTEQEKESYKNSNKGKRRWVVCLNSTVARLDKIKREYFRKIIEKKVEFSTAKEWIVKNGYKKYVVIKDLKIEVNQEKLKDDELYDGKWALITNTDLTPSELIGSYKDLASIERHFRDLKSELELGPIYHHTEKRIRAHIFVCFLALQLKVALTKRLKDLSEELSYCKVMQDVAKIKAVEFKIQDKTVIMRTEVVGNAYQAFRAVNTAVPAKTICM